MLTEMSPMKCGCGGDEFKDENLMIAVECQECKDVSLLTASAQLRVDWGEGSDGVLCKWPKGE